MASITASATQRTVYYQSSVSWRSAGAAFQGAWDNTGSRVGVMVFSGLGTTLKNTIIKSIVIEPKISSGTNGASRTITFWSSNYQSIDTSKNGQSYPKAKLGTLVGNGTNSTGIASTYPGLQKFTLNASTNSALFNALAAYLIAGNTCFLLYNGETANASGYSYSANYLSFDSCSMTVEYENYYSVAVAQLEAKEGGGWNQLAWTSYQVAPNTYFTVPTVTPSATNTTDGVVYNAWTWDWVTMVASGKTPSVDKLYVNQSLRVEVYYKLLHTVTYNANGRGTAPSAQKVTDGKSITLPTMSAPGYKFLGWSTSSTATSGVTGSYTPTASVTLYAVWKRAGSYMYINVDGVPVKCGVFRKTNGAAVRCDCYMKVNGKAVKT